MTQKAARSKAYKTTKVDGPYAKGSGYYKSVLIVQMGEEAANITLNMEMTDRGVVLSVDVYDSKGLNRILEEVLKYDTSVTRVEKALQGALRSLKS